MALLSCSIRTLPLRARITPLRAPSALRRAPDEFGGAIGVSRGGGGCVWSGKRDLGDGVEGWRPLRGRQSGVSWAGGTFTTEAAASALPLPFKMNDLIACGITVGLALLLLRFFDEMASREILEKKLCRKLVHISIGLVYMLCWALFSTAWYAKYLCSLAVALNAVRMLLLGFGIMENEAMVKAMSREGDRRELLYGPFYYAATITAIVIAFWRTSPVGIVALVNLCVGDGFADIVGRNFGGGFQLPWNTDKSWAGSVAFFLSSTIMSILYLEYFSHFGFLQLTSGTSLGVLLVSLLTAIVESLPISTRLDDNLTVPCVATVLGYFILPS